MNTTRAQGLESVATDPRKRDRILLLSLCLIWLLPRAVAFYYRTPSLSWEVWEARKLLEYGFWNRWGAIINWHYMTGIRPDPWAFNYTNHPYPILWLYTLIYYLAGAYAVYVAASLAWFVACIILYRVLSAQFGQLAGWWASVLYCLASNSIYYDTDPNSFSAGAIIWPMALGILYLGPGERTGDSRIRPWLCGLAVLLAGQVSWFSLSALPSLLWLTATPDTPLRDHLRHPLRNPHWRAMIGGTLVTAALFTLQIVVYVPSFKEFWGYFLQQCAMNPGSLSRLAMVPNHAAKTVNLVGPALWLPAVVAVIWMWKARSWPRLAGAALLYLGVFAGIGVLLNRAYYHEASFYRYLLVPVTLLAGLGLSKNSSRWLRVAAIGFAVLGATFTLMKLQSGQPSKVAESVGHKIAELTRPEDIVLTNLRMMAPPFAPWDPGAEEITRLAADRLLRFGIQDLQQAQAAVLPFRRESGPCVFVAEKSLPLSAELEAVLKERSSKIVKCDLVLPPDTETFFLKLRLIYWKFTKRYKVAEASTPGSGGPATAQFQVFYLPSEVFKPAHHD
jgi:hypothetical protein